MNEHNPEIHKQVTRVGAFEAKTHLSQLLDRVAAGEKIIITRRGKDVATLDGSDHQSGGLTEKQKARHAEAAAGLQALARQYRPEISLEEILAWKHEGHKY